jgi:hypothetical protein
MTEGNNAGSRVEPSADYDAVDGLLSLSGDDFYASIQISPEQLRSLAGVGATSWDQRTSIKAGEVLGNPVWWSRNGDNNDVVDVLVGPDDEAWAVWLQIPAAIIRGLLAEVDPPSPPRDIARR